MGVNGLLLSMGQAKNWRKQMTEGNKAVVLKALDDDPVDAIWGEDQPPPPGMYVCMYVLYVGR